MACPWPLAFAGSIKSRHAGVVKQCDGFYLESRSKQPAGWPIGVSSRYASGQPAKGIVRPRGCDPTPTRPKTERAGQGPAGLPRSARWLPESFPVRADSSAGVGRDPLVVRRRLFDGRADYDGCTWRDDCRG